MRSRSSKKRVSRIAQVARDLSAYEGTLGSADTGGPRGSR